MREKLESILDSNRNKLNIIEGRLHELNVLYINYLEEDENNKHLNKLQSEIKYLERQQEIIVRQIRDKKKQLRELMTLN